MTFSKTSVQKPTAFGTLLQSSTYGSVPPTVFGCSKASPLAIWAANIRKGHSTKKFKTKKGAPAYVENIDMLVASNPVAGILQIWSNQNNTYPLNFVRLKVNANLGGSWNSTITIADPHFYAVVAMTMECALNYDLTFDDYGAQGPSTYHNVITPTLYEFPLWNGYQHGPDVNDPGVSRFPYYLWKPADGNVITIAAPQTLERVSTYAMPNPTRPIDAPFGPDFYVYVYYAQTTSATKHQSPLAYNRFTFEEELGDGTEYADAGLSAQQVIHKTYAGVGSDDMDLGTSGAIPSWRFEVNGSYGYMPSSLLDDGQARADCEFPDMIEAIIKSGLVQTGSDLGYVQLGLNCNDLPSVVQKNWSQELEPSNPSLLYPQPNVPGSILLWASRWSRPGSGTPPTIVDSAGDTVIPIVTSTGASQRIAAYVNGCIGGAGNVVDSTYNGGGFPFGADGVIMEFDPGSTEVDGVPVVENGSTGATITASIATSGEPSYIVAIALCDSGFTANPPPQWQNLFPQRSTSGMGVYARKVARPGTYTFTIVNAANEGSLILFAVKSAQASGVRPYPKALGDIIDFDSLMNVRLQCRAGGLQGALTMDSQKKASDWLEDICLCADCAPVWSGFKLKFIARSEVSVIGDGTAANNPAAVNGGPASVFWSPTSLGPVADLVVSDFIGDAGNQPVTISRKAQVDANNIVQAQHVDRNNKYNQATVSEIESASKYLLAPRKLQPKVLNMVASPTVARKILAIMVRRMTLLRNTYSFKLQPKWAFLEAMDLVTLTEPLLGLDVFPMRLTKVVEDPKTHELACEAEQFIYGLHAPQILSATALAPYNPNTSGVPADVNAPIIFEPPLRMCLSNRAEVWFVISDSDPIYGGAIVYASTDGGATYPTVVGTVQGNATTGIVTADWPAAADPDTTNNLSLDLTESLGSLPAVNAVDEANFTFPSYVAGASLYELMAYQVATLTGPNLYTLPAAALTPLRRAVFGLPAAGAGEDHPTNSRFAWLDNREAANVPGILKVPLDPAWIGITVHFKIVAFNLFNTGQQDIADVTDYTYAPTGVGTGTTGSGSGVGSTSQPAYTITGGALTQPTPTSIHMAAATVQFPGSTVVYAARTFTISAPGSPTTYYVTIEDPGQLGDGGSTPVLSAACQTSSALVGVPGEVYIGSIVAIPAGGSTQTGPGGFPLANQISFNGV